MRQRRFAAAIGVRSRPTICWAARNYSNPTRKLLQSDRVITPIRAGIHWEFVDGEKTASRGSHVRHVITPAHFEITPIYVGFQWDSLDEKKSRRLAGSTLYLKYIIIQLQARQK